MKKKILFIDHDDSFSHNIINFFRAQNFSVDYFSYTASELLNPSFPIMEYSALLLSPGPGSPADYPQTIEFYKKIPDILPVLGICLGHQIMLYADGGKIRQICPKPIHGRQLSLKTWVHSPLLGKIKLAGTLILYHSLGYFEDDSVFKIWHAHILHNRVCLMAEHQIKPHIGVQFHPESFGSTLGPHFFNKFIRLLSL